MKQNFYRVYVKIGNITKQLNLYDYKSNAYKSKKELNENGFKKEEILIRTIYTK